MAKGFFSQGVCLPTDHVIGNMITIGEAVKPAWPKPGRLPLEEAVVYDRFRE